MKRKTIVGIFAVVLVIIAVMATGCVEEGTPKYIPGDIIAEKPTADTFLVILDYNQNTDEYKTNYISKVAGEWRHLAEAEYATWGDCDYIEVHYPLKIDHVDLTTIMSWDEYSKAVGYEEVSATPTPKPTPKLTPKPTSAPTPEPTPTKTGITGIIIDYSGKWSGSYGDLTSSKSIEGSGTKTIAMNNPEMCISASIQKKDDSNNKMTVKILKNGKVLEEESTAAAYGVVSVSSFLNGFIEKSGEEVKIKIDYAGAWTGSYGDIDSMKSIDGTGNKIISIPDAKMMVSASIQKMDDSARKLTVQILEGNKVQEEESTTASYGVVSLSYSL
jgi:hypothetical protein